MTERFTDYLMDVSYHYQSNLRQRFGQSCFNVLVVQYPELANEIRGRRYDCSNDNTLVPEFLAKVRDYLDQ